MAVGRDSYIYMIYTVLVFLLLKLQLKKKIYIIYYLYTHNIETQKNWYRPWIFFVMLLKLMSNRAKNLEHEIGTDLNKIFFGRKSFKINRGKSEQWFLSRFDTILKINRVF